jgi:formylglycine-generating enzyme required for sulfatase activity
MIKIEDQFVTIPAGNLKMRDDRKQKLWTAEISPFLIYKHQVTQDLYASIVEENPSAFQDLKCPVKNVSWLDCVKFCNKLSALSGFKCSYEIIDDVSVLNKTANGYRLPTEAEWEYACRAGSNKPRYGELSDIAWYEGNSDGRTHAVGL